MNSSFSFSKFAGMGAMGTWTLGWVLVASHVVEHLSNPGAGNTTLSAIVSFLAVAVGCAMTYRMYPRRIIPSTSKPSPKEPWFRRVTGWFGAIVWCAVSLIWNLSIFRVLIESADKGRNANFVLLVPFSLIGLLLILLLFTGITLVLDSVLQLGNEAEENSAPKAMAEPLPESKISKTDEVLWKDSPVLYALFLFSFVNWFAFFGVSMYLGGDAMGILPSQDGFVVKSHGHHSAVSESAWVFSLFYSAATLLITPLIWFAFGAKQGRARLKRTPLPLSLAIGLFIALWCVGWYSAIGSSFFRSLNDWRKLKQQSETIERVGK